MSFEPFFPSLDIPGRTGDQRTKGNVMSGGEALVVGGIIAVFAFFMVALAWGDMHTRGSRGHWE